ncbi:hypothetical protein [uncultured Parabacteroides sp.]|uniref:hypothetical protein n=1 Tax=uncultured Parabacteroides sp. TaxID=512312 RepID=UPI002803F4CF|nr:hypothetical protein [uncultured Parabacteroides sp.]
MKQIITFLFCPKEIAFIFVAPPVIGRMPFKAQKAVFDKLLEVADVANLSKDERVLYDEALKRYRDYKIRFINMKAESR